MHTVDLTLLVPILGPILLAIVTVFSPFILRKLAMLLHIKYTDAQMAQMTALVDDKASKVYAYLAERGLTYLSVNVKNELLARVLTEIIDEAPGLIASLGLTQDAVHQKLLAAYSDKLVADTAVTLAPSPAPVSATVKTLGMLLVCSLVLSISACSDLTPQQQKVIMATCTWDKIQQPLLKQVVPVLLPQAAAGVSLDELIVHPSVVAACDAIGATPSAVAPASAPAPAPSK